MAQQPTFSLIVPTRGRPARLRHFLDSVAATASRPDRLEVVLVTDEDDPASHHIDHPDLEVRSVVGLAGRTMGALNTAGYEAARGQYLMFLNDDVVIHTRRWDSTVLRCFRRFPDPVALVHVNDTLIRDYLCTFPILPRAYCDLIGDVCPVGYRRYRIDDHIEDVFNLLAVLGHKRAVYLPDVIFEHLNAVPHPTAGRVYESDPDILAQDVPLFDRLFPARKELALRVLEHIEGGSDPAKTVERRAVLDSIADPFSLRVPGRQHVVRSAWWERAPGMVTGAWNRGVACYRRGGCGGVMRAAARRLACLASSD